MDLDAQRATMQHEIERRGWDEVDWCEDRDGQGRAFDQASPPGSRTSPAGLNIVLLARRSQEETSTFSARRVRLMCVRNAA